MRTAVPESEGSLEGADLLGVWELEEVTAESLEEETDSILPAFSDSAAGLRIGSSSRQVT